MARKSQYANEEPSYATARDRFYIARFEYRAYISRYLQVAHWVSDRFLARFVHRGCCYGVYTYPGRVRRYCSEPPFRGRKFLKLLKRLTVG